jgi:hypothetical protein
MIRHMLAIKSIQTIVLKLRKKNLHKQIDDIDHINYKLEQEHTLYVNRNNKHAVAGS